MKPTPKALMVEKYKYLYKNAYVILAIYMKEETKKQQELREKIFSDLNLDFTPGKREISLSLPSDGHVENLLERYLLGTKAMPDTELFQIINSIKSDRTSMLKVRKGIELLNRLNKSNPDQPLSLDLGYVLKIVATHIENQTGDEKNKDQKLKVIDEYFRLYRYTNDPEINYYGIESPNEPPLITHKPTRLKKDIGIKENSFIRAIIKLPRGNNNSIFTEEEKQAVFQSLNDVLPWNLTIKCEEDLSAKPLTRPTCSKPCGKSFRVSEDRIFQGPSSNLNSYYQICPYCGYITKLPVTMLSPNMRTRIAIHTANDPTVHKRAQLYSEQLALEHIYKEKGQKILQLVPEKKDNE